MSVDKFNSEGNYDPTAYEAMSIIEKEERVLRAFRPIVYIDVYKRQLLHRSLPNPSETLQLQCKIQHI